MSEAKRVDSTSSQPLIEVREISKRYSSAGADEWALREVNLTIDHGEMVAIRGTSGSGKTTLLNIIGGLDQSFEGELRFRGHARRSQTELMVSSERNQEIGFIFQHFSLLDHLSALDNVILPAMLAKEVSRERSREALKDPEGRAIELLERVGLGHKLSALPTELSGGQKQRVAIARALFFEPPLLLCDEPTGSLDTHTGEQIIQLFRELNQEGYTVVMITHEDRVSSAAKRVIELEDGRVISDERPDGVDLTQGDQTHEDQTSSDRGGEA